MMAISHKTPSLNTKQHMHTKHNHNFNTNNYSFSPHKSQFLVTSDNVTFAKKKKKTVYIYTSLTF